jgi:cobalt-zinc-cadmium efflux system membrane fusion protein
MHVHTSGSPLLRNRALVAVVTAVLAGGALLAAGLMHPAARATAPDAAPAQPAPGTFRPTKAQREALKVAPVQAITFRSEEITDGVIANNDDTTTPVFSPYSGRVAKVFAKLGDVVRAGAPLMAVEASEFVQGQDDLTTAVAALASARAQLDVAQTAEKRQHELYLGKSGALKDWLQSQSDLVVAQGAVKSADVALEAARNRLRILGKSTSEIDALEADHSGRINAEAIVRAPISGTVLQRQVGLGQYIQSAAGGASNSLFSIGNLSTVWLVANVREVDAPRMKVGQALEVQVMALPKRTFQGRIAWVAPAIDPNTRRLQVRAEIDNRDGALTPMMFATFHIQTGESSRAPGIPEGAIVYEGSDAHVFVARPDGTLAVRSIRVGRSSGNMVEVVSGLSVGDQVVTSGALFIDRATAGQ